MRKNHSAYRKNHTFLLKKNVSIQLPVAFEAAWILTTLAAPNHRVYLCSWALLAFRRRATSMALGIYADI